MVKDPLPLEIILWRDFPRSDKACRDETGEREPFPVAMAVTRTESGLYSAPPWR